MKRILVVGLVLILLLSGLAACSKSEPADPGQSGETNATAGKTEAEKAETKGGKEGDKELTPYEAFDSFRNAREDVSGQISGPFIAVYNEFEDTRLYLNRFESGDKEMYMHAVEVLLGHTDVATWADRQWYEEESVELGQDDEIQWMTYGGSGSSDPDKVTVQLVDGNNWMILTKGVNEEVSFYMEFVRTSYGYAAQYYYGAWDTNNHFLFTVGDKEKTFFMGEKDGMIGMTSSDGIPPRLTGNEAPDFPKSAPEWYNVEGDKLIYKTAEGKEYTFDKK